MIKKQQLNQLFQYCYSLTVNTDDAYDLLQMCLEKYLKINKQACNNDIAYIRKIIRNQFIDNQRRKKILAFESLEAADCHATIAIETTSLEDVMIAQDKISIIWGMLNTSDREIVYLWAILGYSARQISEELDVPRGTILSKIHRLRERILKKFDKLDLTRGNS